MASRSDTFHAPPAQPQNHQRPLPYAHQHQGPPGTASAPSRRSRTFSFKSDKSSGSNKADLIETHDEKEAKRLHTKANPLAAMNEAEPAVIASREKSSLASLRSMQHKDAFGNPITDPDRSNPTRSRWERPLDTIRSFEAAIDGGYNRKSVLRPDSESIANWNRRSSYFAGNRPNESYYGSRPQSMFRPESQYDPRQGGMGQGQRESYMDQQNGGGYYNNGYNNNGGYSNGNNTNNNGYPPVPPQHGVRRAYPRGPPEPQWNPQRADPNVYPNANNHRSYETVASASGSGSSGEPTGYQTDPTSSDNSSIERVQSPPKPEPINDYGIGFSQSSNYQQPAFTVGMNAAKMNGRPADPYQNGTSNYGTPPPVPQKGVISRKPTAAAAAAAASAPPVQARPPPPEKRKSWFARRFSKNSNS